MTTTKEELFLEMLSKGFKLGGSRRANQKWGDAIPISVSTDYDIYCPNEQRYINWLLDNGFKKVAATNRTYWDDLLIDIYKNHLGFECLVRSDAKLYERAFESISLDDYKLRLWKSNLDSPPQNMLCFRASVCAWFNCLFAQLSSSSNF